ncbi:MAG: N-acetyltransferase [Frankiales bacterium]|jgi:predicted GNAT family acetyltransferase|nr:N-acetyltransferase [Frankiales bacterium]
MPVQVENVPERSRFEAEVEGQTAFLAYEVHGDTVVMPHTVVPRELEGQGIAGELTRTAVAWAREQSLTIDAQCSYVRSWLAKHPDA